MAITAIKSVVPSAVGGENVDEVIDGHRRFPITVRYQRKVRDSLKKLRQIPIVIDKRAQARLGDLAGLKISDDPPMIRSESARLTGYVYVDIQNADICPEASATPL